MAAETKKKIELEIAHVLFIDIVGYSKLSINEQNAAIDELTQIVRGTAEFKKADASDRLIKIATGDGMALVFYNTPEAPVRCAIEVTRAIKDNPRLRLRMGVHSGPVSGVIDVNERTNLAGAGLNLAQRVMNCGDSGHILLSKHVAEDLAEFEEWRPLLHVLGACEVKHETEVSVVNLYGSGVGNPELPATFRFIKQRSVRRRNTLVAAALIAGAAIIAGGIWFSRTRMALTLGAPEKSIAVLPFENLSDEKENAYFASGMQDDVLTNLAKIGDLKVISRTSVIPYRDHVRNVREIGKALGVSTVLEGSVRRAGNRVRVNVQLINASNDEHLWAENYDRELTDVFVIQSDLARKIASALQAKLSPNENARLDRRPTHDSDAYLLYVQAHDYANQPDRLREPSLKAEALYEKAIKIDSNFALAFAGLSIVESWMYHTYEPIAARREKARLNADEALRLESDLPEGHLALGYSYYYGDRDYQRALTEFEIAKRDLPNEADAYTAIAAIQRRQGKWAESNANFEKSASLDPKNPNVLWNFAFNYMAQRDFEAADKLFDRAIAVDPQSFSAVGMKSFLPILWKGDIGSAENQLSKIPPGFDPDGLVTASRIWVLTLQRKFAEALQVVQQFPGETLTYPERGPCPKTAFEGSLYLYLGEKEKAQAAFEQARIVAERLVRDAPDDPGRHAQLGAVLAGLGKKEDAINEGKKAVELLPESEDAFDGPQVTVALAEIYAWVGEHDEAIRLLDHLLTIPSALTVATLKLDPTWDSLRNDPRFQKIVASVAPKDAGPK